MEIKCKKHPTYKAIRKPRTGCERCQEIFDIRQRVLSVIPLHRIKDKKIRKAIEEDIFDQFKEDMMIGRDLDTYTIEYEFDNGAILKQTRNKWLGA